VIAFSGPLGVWWRKDGKVLDAAGATACRRVGRPARFCGYTAGSADRRGHSPFAGAADAVARIAESPVAPSLL
jgi:hypothetical protein